MSLQQRFLGALTVGDVNRRALKSDEVAFRVAHRQSVLRDPQPPAFPMINLRLKPRHRVLFINEPDELVAASLLNVEAAFERLFLFGFRDQLLRRAVAQHARQHRVRRHVTTGDGGLVNACIAFSKMRRNPSRLA